MAMRSLPSIKADAADREGRELTRSFYVALNSASKARQHEQQLAHIARCEERARVNGQPRYT